MAFEVILVSQSGRSMCLEVVEYVFGMTAAAVLVGVARFGGPNLQQSSGCSDWARNGSIGRAKAGD